MTLKQCLSVQNIVRHFIEISKFQITERGLERVTATSTSYYSRSIRRY